MRSNERSHPMTINKNNAAVMTITPKQGGAARLALKTGLRAGLNDPSGFRLPVGALRGHSRVQSLGPDYVT